MSTVKIGLIGTGFVADLHAAAARMVPDVQIVAVASPTPGKAAHFARERGIPHAFEDYGELLRLKDVQLVTLALPNHLHAQACLDAARAGKHVVCEKPLCRTLEEADRMIEACRRAGVLLMYAEELCFAPKYVRAKQLADEVRWGASSLSSRARSTLGRTRRGSGM